MFIAEIDYSDPEFFEALRSPQKFEPFMVKAMEEVLEGYRAVAEVYAPESEANRPGRIDSKGKPMGYYERGRGSWRPVLTNRTLGGEIPLLRPHLKSPKTLSSRALLAEGFSGVAGYKLQATSQKMHDQWRQEVHATVDGVIGNLRNLATYSGYVQGPEQTALHRSRSWETVMGSWEDPAVQSVVEESITKALVAFYHLGG